MTPLQNGSVANGTNGHRAKRSVGRVLPAIPLALTKPKQQVVRPPPKVDAAAVKTSTPTTNLPAASEKNVNGGAAHNAAEEVGVQNSKQTSTAGELQQEPAHGGNTQPVVETPVSRGSAAMSPSNGATPEPAVSEAPSQPLTNGQATASSPTVTSSPAASRRPLDRFEMRQIRTELPPAFVPAGEQQTPLSAASSQQRPPGFPHGHPAHPSTSSIIFGGNESSGSSPAPPPGIGSAFMPPPPPPNAPLYGHAHHASEPYPQRFQNGAQPPAPFAMRPGFAPPQQFNHPHAHFRYPPREHFTPNGFAPRSRSGSHTSSRAGLDLQSPIGMDQSIDSAKTMSSEGKPSFGNRQIPPPFQQHMPPPPSSFAHPEMAAGFENAESMRDHVLSQFRNPAFADCQIRVSEQDSGAHAELDGHRLIIARSPKLADISRAGDNTTSSGASTNLDIQLKGRYVRIGPFVDAVRYLYGGPLPPFDLYNLGPNTLPEDRVEVALQYIATGAWLNIHAVAQRGVEIASSLLQWDTITPILAFALDGGLGQIWPAEDGSEERTSTCSSDDSSTKPEAGGAPAYEPHSSALLTRVLEFAAHNLPPNFYINSSAPQSAACPRLPSYPQRHESKSSRSDPRLSKIRFGEMGTEDHQRPSFATTAVSSILLSLPFPLLKYLLEHPALANRLGADTIGSIMRQVVNEREVRRQKALRARVASQEEDHGDYQQIQNLYWEESVEPSNHTRAGFRLSRRRRGIDTPPSSSETDAPK
ncbi:hypothetical protein Slin15195_G088490 [Septoria linicola]|uniref:Uncharacterized protein n=1 Tax=Septoria linicola TaxID=215465 RepID=A0A9Q9ELZ1_9PEZI|nr:hypothetical protein Slin15195_G088490 [Septoria linicola]